MQGYRRRNTLFYLGEDDKECESSQCSCWNWKYNECYQKCIYKIDESQKLSDIEYAIQWERESNINGII